MTATPVSKPERPSASFGKSSSATASIISGLPCCGDERRRASAGSTSGCCSDLAAAPADHDDVQRQVDADDRRPRGRSLPEALEEDAPRAAPAARSVSAIGWSNDAGTNGLLDDVRGRVRGRERDGDDEVGRREPEQAQHERLAAPARQQLLEHRDAALAVRAVLGDAAVDRQRAEQRQQDEDERRDRRERAGGEEGDAGLIAERREVVDAGEAHDLPPRRLVDVSGRAGRPARAGPRKTTA